jgi:uncharacterized protein (TIGR03000 family)
MASLKPTEARILVKLPANAKMTVNDEPTEVTSMNQLFSARGLEAGKAYRYTFKAQLTRHGKVQDVMRQVTVQAGEKVEVDLGDSSDQPVEESLPSRPSKATLIVSLPPDAQLTVNDEPTEVASGKRVFVAPNLEPGRVYPYTFKARVTREGKVHILTRQIKVRAGDKIQVSFPGSDAETPAK